MLLSNFTVLVKNKSIFIKNKKLYNFHNISNGWFRMNKIITKFLLTGDKFMLEPDLQHPEFTFQKIRKTGNIYTEMN